ncbi:MAG: hypothetical protein J0L56_08095 [Chitinophagales bacterium]|nr:hypothetical protein [Chitinophagales bacterium]
MKQLLLLMLLVACSVAFSQQQTFDIATYSLPKGWQKETTASAVLLSREDPGKDIYCFMQLYKSLPGAADSKANFDDAWETIVKKAVTIASPPEMQPAATDNGWEIQSGYALYESDDTKGIAMLITSSSNGKMVNLVILTNTDSYEKDISAFLESISLKTIPQTNEGVVTNPSKPAPVNTIAKTQGFAFTTTNFDDGWTSTVQEDWVEVKKAGLKVLIHYPNKQADEYNSVLMDGLKVAWDILVAPRYSSASGMEFKPVSGWEPIEYAEAMMVEKVSGKNVFVVFFKKNYSNGSGRYLEFIAPDKATFEQQFGVYRQESYGWEKMEVMASYNKFAVAATDLTGVWTSNFTGIQQYVNANTGANAGMDTHSSAQNFEFSANGTYKWDLAVASGFVGNIKFQGVKSSGNFKLLNNWQIYFSEIEKKPKTYNAFFSCIKGARILWLQDTGYGDYSGYGKKD